MYQVGKIYIWQNLPPRWAYLNGRETTVTGSKMVRKSPSVEVRVWCTDTPHDRPQHLWVHAFAGELRPKEPPRGEQSVLDMFKQPMPGNWSQRENLPHAGAVPRHGLLAYRRADRNPARHQ